MAQDERARLKQAGFTDEEINAYLAKQSAAPMAATKARAENQEPVPTQRLRSLAQGATFGFADELEAAARSILPGETYEQAIQDVRGKMAAYQQDRPVEALGYEVAGGLATGLAGGGRALAASAGRAGLRSALKAGASKAATSAIGQGALGGAGAAEGSLENRLKGAAVGGAFGAALPFGFAQLGRLPVAKQVGQEVSRAYDVARRGAANLAEGTPLQSVGRMFEPTDATRISRQAAEALPGGVEGPTIASMAGGQEVARTVETQASVAARQAGLTARQATAARKAAQEEARAAVRQAQQEEAALDALTRQRAASVGEIGGTRAERLAQTSRELAAEAKGEGKRIVSQEVRAANRAKLTAEEEARAAVQAAKGEEAALTDIAEQQAGEISGRGKARAKRLTGAAKKAAEEARALQSQAREEVALAGRATREQAKAAAESVLEESRAAAGETIGQLRGRQPRGAAKRLQEVLRNKQLSEGEESYRAIREIGAPPQTDIALHTEIINDPQLRKLYDDVNRELMDEARKRPAGEGPIFRSIRVGDDDITELTLEGMDRLRRRLVEPQFRKDPNVVGLSSSQRSAILDKANRLEERFLAGYGDDAAADALRNFRSQYRERFVRLEAVRDGLNLGSVKAGRTSGILKQGTRELDEVAKRVDEMTPNQRTAFQVGAREWFDRLIQESKGDALAIAEKFRSEAGQRRLALIFGDEAVESLRKFAPDVIGQQQKAAAARVREEGKQFVQQTFGTAEQKAAALLEKGQRAAALGTRAREQGAGRAQQILAEQKAASGRRIADVQRAAGEQVRAARGAAGEAQVLAEDIAAARRGATDISPLAQRVAGEIEGATAPLTERAQRAAALAQRQEAQTAARTQQLVGQRQSDRAQRLADVRRQAQERVQGARATERSAVEEAGRLATALSEAKVARSQAKTVPFKDLAGALGGSTRQQTFLQRLLPQMTAEQRAQAVDVLGSNLQRELQDLSRSGKSPEVILQRVRELQQNDAVRELFGPQMEAFVQQLSPTVGSRLPQLFRPSISGTLGRRIGANYNE